MGRGPSLEIDLAYALSLAGMRASESELRSILARLRGPLPPGSWRSALRRLQRRKLVFKHRQDGQAVVRLTVYGRVRTSLPSPRAVPFPAPDGFLYFITYDLPVSLGGVLRILTRSLARQGWQKVHKSLWASGRDLRTEAMATVDDLGLRPHCRLGTCVFLEEFTPRRGRSVAAGVEALAAVERDAEGRVAEAFRRWVELTEALREPASADGLTKEAREAWKAAYRRLGVAVAAVAGAGEAQEAG